jgi:hypothetical protein
MYVESLYERIFLAFPDGMPNRADLCALYVYVVNSVPPEIPLTLFVNDGTSFRARFQSRVGRAVELVELPLSDIWLGDYFPYRLGADSFVAFQYGDGPAGQKDQDALLSFLRSHYPARIDTVPLRLDFGAFDEVSHVLLVSDIVYNDNATHSRAEVDAILSSSFGDPKLIVCKSPFTLGHIDTMFRVFDNVVLYNSRYVPPALLASVREALAGEGMALHDLPFEIAGGLNAEGVEDYRGNVFDFIAFQDFLLYPVTGQADRAGLSRLEAILQSEGSRKRIVVLDHEDMPRLYSGGGGLLCVAGMY